MLPTSFTPCWGYLCYILVPGSIHDQVVAVFGSIHMGASRIMNLQRHRIAQCRSVVIRIFGDEGVPVQADGEAWVHPPGIIRGAIQ